MIDSKKRLVFDIETLGADLADLDEQSQEYFSQWAQKDFETQSEALEAIEKNLNFYPLTAQVVSVAVFNPETKKGAVYFQSDKNESFKEGEVEYKSAQEKEILAWFWQVVKDYDEIVSFNGRTFDVPFLMIRSAIQGVKPSVDLLRDRYGSYDFKPRHIDLMDRLTFFGILRRRLPLDLWAKAFSIESPKKDFTGNDIKRLFKEGKHKEIARYCLGDVYATAKLYEYWDKYLRQIPNS